MVLQLVPHHDDCGHGQHLAARELWLVGPLPLVQGALARQPHVRLRRADALLLPLAALRLRQPFASPQLLRQHGGFLARDDGLRPPRPYASFPARVVLRTPMPSSALLFQMRLADGRHYRRRRDDRHPLNRHDGAASQCLAVQSPPHVLGAEALQRLCVQPIRLWCGHG